MVATAKKTSVIARFSVLRKKHLKEILEENQDESAISPTQCPCKVCVPQVFAEGMNAVKIVRQEHWDQVPLDYKIF